MQRTLFCTLVLLVLLFACTKAPNDQQIVQDLQTKISTDPKAREAHVTVESQKGKVTLKGDAKDESVRAEVEKIAKEEQGVTAVNDEVLLSAAATEGTPAPKTESYASSAPVTPATTTTAHAAPQPKPEPIVVPKGTTLTIRTTQLLGSKTSQTGMRFTGTLASPITVDGKMVLPQHSEVSGVVKNAKKAGRIKGAAALALTLHSINVNGHTYNIETSDVGQESVGKGKRSVGIIGGGTGLGAVIGGIAGGGKGAAIGALTGAAGGAVAAGTTGNRDIELPAESALSFKLLKDLTLNDSDQHE